MKTGLPFYLFLKSLCGSRADGGKNENENRKFNQVQAVQILLCVKIDEIHIVVLRFTFEKRLFRSYFFLFGKNPQISIFSLRFAQK